VKKEKAKAKGRPIPLGKSMLGVVALGLCLGAALAWMKQRPSPKKREAVQHLPENFPGTVFPDTVLPETLSPLLFPEASAPPLVEEAPSAPGLPAAMEGLPLYPGSMPQGFEASVIADGKLLKMARFFTQDSVAQLRAFYEKEFRRRGVHLVSHEFSPVAGYIGYMDWLSEELHLISYIRQGSQTLAFPSRSRPSLRGQGELPAGIPAHPRASLAKTVSFVEPEGRQRLSYSARIADERLESVWQFYREALLSGGWQTTQEREEEGRNTLEAANERWVVNVALEQKPGSVGVYVLLMGR